jgi:hypothetical protein
MRRHRHRHHRHCRFSHLWYWATGAAIVEAAFWAAIPGAIAIWWLLWAAAWGAMAATRRMWHLTEPGGCEPRWQQALDAARPPWPKRTRRMVTR